MNENKIMIVPLWVLFTCGNFLERNLWDSHFGLKTRPPRHVCDIDNLRATRHNCSKLAFTAQFTTDGLGCTPVKAMTQNEQSKMNEMCCCFDHRHKLYICPYHSGIVMLHICCGFVRICWDRNRESRNNISHICCQICYNYFWYEKYSFSEIKLC